MATFKNRALTLATVGVLTAFPLTVATNGALQPAEAVVEPEVPVTQPTGGVSRYRAPGERFVLEYPRLHEHVSPLWVELFDQTRVEFDRAQIAQHEIRSALDLFVTGISDTGYSSLQKASSRALLGLVSDVYADKGTLYPGRPAHAVEIRSNTVARVYHPGDFVHVSQLTARMGGEADALHWAGRPHKGPKVRPAPQPAPAPVQPAPAPAPAPAPKTEPAPQPVVQETTVVQNTTPRTHDHVATKAGQVYGEASIRHLPADYREHSHRAVAVADIGGAATYWFDSDDYRIVVRVEAALNLGIFGGSVSAILHDTAPHVDEDDAEILALFMQIMRDREG